MALLGKCGQSKSIVEAVESQKNLKSLLSGGKSALNNITDKTAQTIAFVNELSLVPGAKASSLQDDIINLINNNPGSSQFEALQRLSALGAKYGEIAYLSIQKVALFYTDPLNNRLDICTDIPNIKKLNNETVVAAKAAFTPAPDVSPTPILVQTKDTMKKVLTIGTSSSPEEFELEGHGVIDTYPRFSIPDVNNDIVLGGRYSPKYSGPIGPGSAQKAAMGVKYQKYEYTVAAADPSIPMGEGDGPLPVIEGFEDLGSLDDVQYGEYLEAVRKSGAYLTEDKYTPDDYGPIDQSIANPFADGNIYTADSFKSRYRSVIAQKINLLDPAVRSLFANGIQAFLQDNEGWDLTVVDTYRTWARSAELAREVGRTVPVAKPGKSWHNYRLAMDVTLFENGKVRLNAAANPHPAYVTTLREAMRGQGLINDISGDPGHFYVRVLGSRVPDELFEQTTPVQIYLQRKGFINLFPGGGDTIASSS